MDLKKTIANVKEQCKTHAPVIIATVAATMSTIAAIAVYRENQLLNGDLDDLSFRADRDRMLERAWNEMKNTGEVQHIVNRDTSECLFDMTPVLQED